MESTVSPSRAPLPMPLPSPSPSPVPRQRAILLGASNVTRGLATVIDASRLQLGGPIDFLAAIGHGRSYGRPSRVLGRRLTGILECGLWDELARRPPLPTVGLITDVGNDILLGVPLATIQDWLERTFERMRLACEMIVVTELPLEIVGRLSPRRYRLFRSLLFPKSRLEYSEAIDSAHAVNRHLVELSDRFRATLVRPNADWYAIDPIHVLRRSSAVAWRTILASWSPHADAVPNDSDRGSRPHRLAAGGGINWRQRWSLRFVRPLEQQWFGWTQTCPQPSCVFDDGTRVSLF